MPSVSDSLVLGLQECTTIPSSDISCKWKDSNDESILGVDTLLTPSL
jgi:hypothetical protein